MVVVDVNYMPGFRGLPDPHGVLLRHLLRVALSHDRYEGGNAWRSDPWLMAPCHAGCTPDAVAWAPSEAEQWNRGLLAASRQFTSQSAESVLGLRKRVRLPGVDARRTYCTSSKPQHSLARASCGAVVSSTRALPSRRTTLAVAVVVAAVGAVLGYSPRTAVGVRREPRMGV